MNILKWFRKRLTVRGKGVLLYERGMAKANRHDQRGAIDDYTASINLPDAPANIVAMALFNRALVQLAAGEFEKGVDDFTTVLAMEGAPANVKKMAQQKLDKRNSHRHRSIR